MARRYNMQVEIPAGARKALDQLQQQTGLPKVQLVGRLLDWFSDQDEFVQLSVLGVLSDSLKQDVARMKLEQMARGEGVGSTVDKLTPKRRTRKPDTGTEPCGGGGE
jgi:hypothetical protein